jgi:hypothetical protein
MVAWLAQARTKSFEWDRIVAGKQQHQRCSTSKPAEMFAQREVVEHRRQWLTMTNEMIQYSTSKRAKVFSQWEVVEH